MGLYLSSELYSYIRFISNKQSEWLSKYHMSHTPELAFKQVSNRLLRPSMTHSSEHSAMNLSAW